jgi:hypothetical protein
MTEINPQTAFDEPFGVRVFENVVVVHPERAEIELVLSAEAARETSRRLAEAAEQIREGDHS